MRLLFPILEFTNAVGLFECTVPPPAPAPADASGHASSGLIWSAEPASVYGCHTRQCIMAGNACGARAFQGPPMCTSMVLRNPSNMGKVQTPLNIGFRTNVSMICVIGNARDPRAFL